jgi:RNA-directed DNA polymerase
MGKRSAAGELFLGNMGSIQRGTRPSMQREDQPTMETKLGQIAAKARCEPKLRFTSLAHHITCDRVRKNLLRIPRWSAAGVDGQTVEAAKKSFDEWLEPMLQSIHRQGYRAPDIDPGPDAVLHAKPEGQLQGWDAHREISLAAQPYVPAGAYAANPAFYDR